jgi:putative membrane protein
MLWVKAFHIVFVASWFAGLFYLPRIFVNLAMVPAGSMAERERLLLMARKLLRFTTLLAVPALASACGCGWATASAAGRATAGCTPSWRGAAGHRLPPRLRRAAAQASWRAQNRRSHRWYRWFNEAAGAAAAGRRGAGGRQAVLSPVHGRAQDRRPGPWRRPTRRWSSTPASIPSPAGATRASRPGPSCSPALAQVLDGLRRSPPTWWATCRWVSCWR